MPGNDPHTRILRIRVQADDQYLTDNKLHSTKLGWDALEIYTLLALEPMEQRANDFGDVKITVEGWEEPEAQEQRYIDAGAELVALLIEFQNDSDIQMAMPVSLWMRTNAVLKAKGESVV